jgi:glycosyltransferase involved in cell wall biosynthesis
MPRLKKLVEQLGLQDRVILTGELGDARPAYAACDVVVLPSGQPEPFGGVVIEAMCMAKPVIATAVGGSPDQVIDGETGFLVPPADAQALASKILFLYNNPATREEMGQHGFERARNHFGIRQMVDKVESIYSELLAE